jgi:hypothetical protein
MDNSTTHDREDQNADKHADAPGTEDNDGAPAPFAPDSDDKTPLGDTDEHSDA